MKTYDKDQKHIISDNIEALQLIVDQGILDLLVPKAGANSAFYSYQTEHHYCLASNHIGHGTQEDNGYMVVMIPKTDWTFKEAAQFFADAIVETNEGISYGYAKIPPKQNN